MSDSEFDAIHPLEDHRLVVQSWAERAAEVTSAPSAMSHGNVVGAAADPDTPPLRAASVGRLRNRPENDSEIEDEDFPFGDSYDDMCQSEPESSSKAPKWHRWPGIRHLKRLTTKASQPSTSRNLETPKDSTNVSVQLQAMRAPAEGVGEDEETDGFRTDVFEDWLEHASSRPPGVVPKSPKEQAFAEQLWRAQQKEAERERKRLEQIERKKEKEKKAKELFYQQAKEAWINVIIPNWSEKFDSQKVRNLVLKGIPPSVRRYVWPLMIGNELCITPDLYHTIRRQAQRVMAEKERLDRKAMEAHMKTMKIDSRGQTAENAKTVKIAENVDVDNEQSAESAEIVESEDTAEAVESGETAEAEDVCEDAESEIIRRSSRLSEAKSLSSLDDPEREMMTELSKRSAIGLIHLDLPRTFPEFVFFAEDTPMQRLMNDILEAYSVYRPDLGYVQGMSYLAAVFLLFIDDEYQSFSCLANMLSQHHFRTFYKMDMDSIRIHLDTYEFFLKSHLPDLHSHMEKLGVVTECYALDWFLTIFGKALPVDLATRVWDRFLLDGEYVICYTGIGLLKYFQTELLNWDFSDCMQFLTHLPAEQLKDDESNLFRTMDSVRSAFAARDFYAELGQRQWQYDLRRQQRAAASSSQTVPEAPTENVVVEEVETTNDEN